MSVSEATKEENVSDNSAEDKDLFSDIKYICGSTSLIVESLQKGLDIAQLPNGDVIVTEVKTVNTQYSWNDQKQRMVKVGQTQ
ncbi:MAG: hypothetical protein Tsb006_7680 [Rickettsiaceae bacterium]